MGQVKILKKLIDKKNLIRIVFFISGNVRAPLFGKIRHKKLILTLNDLYVSFCVTYVSGK